MWCYTVYSLADEIALIPVTSNLSQSQTSEYSDMQALDSYDCPCGQSFRDRQKLDEHFRVKVNSRRIASDLTQQYVV